MPTTKRKSRDRRLLEQSIEREQQWQARLEESEANLAVSNEHLETVHETVRVVAGRASLAVRQGLYVKDLFARLAQRYAGVQLDVQRMTIGQADEFVKRELDAMEHGLMEVAAQVEAEQAQFGEAVAMRPDAERQELAR